MLYRLFKDLETLQRYRGISSEELLEPVELSAHYAPHKHVFKDFRLFLKLRALVGFLFLFAQQNRTNFNEIV